MKADGDSGATGASSGAAGPSTGTDAGGDSSGGALDTSGGAVDSGTEEGGSGSGGAPLRGCDAPFADPNEVLDFHIQLSRQAWAEIGHDDPVFNGECNQYPYHPVEFRCGDDEPWIEIGARRKRGDHFGIDNDQKPFLKFDFNEYVMGQAWPEAAGNDGFRKLTLANGQRGRPGHTLPLLLTEELAWRLMRAELPLAASTTYAKLYVHFTDDGAEEYHGIYIVVEDINRSAIRRRFDDEGGVLTKDTGSNCDGVVYDDGPPNQAADSYAAWEQLDPADFPGAWWDQTDSAMHLQDMLTQEAIRDVMGNFANATGQYQENYLTFDPTQGKRMYLPWDMDQVFARPDAPAVDGSVLSCDSPLAQRTRCNPDIQPMLLPIICDLINGTMSAENILAEAAAIDDLLRPLIPEERDALWTDRQDPLTTNGDGLDTYQEQLDHTMAWVPDRIDNVRAQLQAAGYDCPVR